MCIIQQDSEALGTKENRTADLYKQLLQICNGQALLLYTVLLQPLCQTLLLHKLITFWLMCNLNSSCVQNAAAFRRWLAMLSHQHHHVLNLTG